MNTPAQTVADIQAVFLALEDRWGPFRQNAIRNYKYVIGDQLSDTIRKMLREEQRPEMIFNFVQGKIIALAGTIENNHAYMKAVPVREGDEKGAEMHTVLVSDYAIKNCNGYREIAKAAVDAAIAGIGWTNNYVSFRKNPEGDWITEAFDPLMVMFDPMTRKADLSDCKYLVVSAFYTAEEIIQIFKGSLAPELIQKIREEDRRITGGTQGNKPKSWRERLAGWAIDLFKTDEQRIAEKGSLSTFLDARNGIYRVIEFHDLRNEEKRVVYSPFSRQSKELRPIAEGEEQATYEAYVQQESQNVGGIVVDLNNEQRWITAVAPGLLPEEVLLEKPYQVQGQGWQHKPIFGYNFHPDITKTNAVIDVLIHPQDSYNQRQMTSLEVVMDGVHPSWMVRKDSIEPLDLDDWKSKKRGVLKFYKGNEKPEAQLPAAGVVQALQALAEEHRDMGEQLTGITPNVMGSSETKNESGRLYAQRVRQSMTMMAYYMGNITFSMSQIFNYCDRNLQQFMKLPRAIRLLDKKNQPQWLQLNMQTLQGVINDVTQGEFDFVVDSSQIGETAKQMQFALMLDALKIIPPQYIEWPKVIKMMDVADADEMAAFAQQIMQMQMGIAQKKMQMQQEADKLQLVKQTGETVAQLETAAGPDAQGAAA